jgi:hypothetical protein
MNDADADADDVDTEDAAVTLVASCASHPLDLYRSVTLALMQSHDARLLVLLLVCVTPSCGSLANQKPSRAECFAPSP